MEADVKVIDDVCEIEPLLRSPRHDVEPRERQFGWRQSTGYRFAEHALRGDERRAGKTAKLIDLSARLKCAAM
jgi:hypothetical protein